MLPEERAKSVRRIRPLWTAASPWGPREPGAKAEVRMWRKPIRAAMRPAADCIAPKPTATKEGARAQLVSLIDRWPHECPRLAIEGDTGLGKTHKAIDRMADHVATGIGLVGAILFVVHDLKRLDEVLALLRKRVEEKGGDPSRVKDLLGRQPIDVSRGEDFGTRRFGCIQHEIASRAGTRGRRVGWEVCGACPARATCKELGYLAHTKEAERATVVVTTVQRLPTVPTRLWKGIVAVVCDEDAMPGLVEEFYVLQSDLRRAVRWIERRADKEEWHDLAAVLPLVRDTQEIVRKFSGKSSEPLLSLLSEPCKRTLDSNGANLLQRAMPILRRDAEGVAVRSESAPASWERASAARLPRQVWGRFLAALGADLGAGDSTRASIVRVVRLRHRRNPGRLHVVRFAEQAIKRLRERPLLLLDATLHPAVGPVLDVERVAIDYDQGRQVVQVLASLHDMHSLLDSKNGGLSPLGCGAVARMAAWADGRRGWILCRKGMVPAIAAEAGRYHELRHMRFTTPRRERGWNAGPEDSVFIVLGRYARDEASCEREAHALRSLMLRIRGTTADLDALERPPGPQPFQGRGVPVLYRGELVERKTREPKDRLAALIQDADRVATVTQFIGRDRHGSSYVLLLRGDPTIPVDALVACEDLAEALPIGAPPPVVTPPVARPSGDDLPFEVAGEYLL